jgi:AraC-like DNA-binding protein
MTKSDSAYEPHLILRDLALPPAEEWTPPLSGWSVIRVAQGHGYYLHSRLNHDLAPGTVLVLPGQAGGLIRASQVGGASLCHFRVEPDRLIGIVTAEELNSLRSAGALEHLAVRVFSNGHSIAQKLKDVCTQSRESTIGRRLELLQIFSDALSSALARQRCIAEQDNDARRRLAELLEKAPACELVEMSLPDLAQKLRCTPRHLSRIFRELSGMSFREKQTELRLIRAGELLVSTKAKVLDVALDSGYQSQSLFNDLFKRRFGLTPARWRERQRYKNGQRRTVLEPADRAPIQLA